MEKKNDDKGWVRNLSSYMYKDEYFKYTGKEGQKYVCVKEPVTDEVLRNHLSNKQPIAIRPFKEKGFGHIIAFDFDDHDGILGIEYMEQVASIFSTTLDKLGYKHKIVQSGSGTGHHIFIVWEEKKSIEELRTEGFKILQAVNKKGIPANYTDIKGKAVLLQLAEGTGGIVKQQIEMFPTGENSKAIAVPLARKSISVKKQGNTLIPCDSNDLLLNTMSTTTSPEPEGEDIVAACKAFEKVKGDLSDYDEWIKVAFIIRAALGDAGFPFFLHLSQNSDNFVSDEDVQEKWNRYLTNPKVSPEAFWTIAVKGGYKGKLPTGIKISSKKDTTVINSLNEKYSIVREGSKVGIAVQDTDEIMSRKCWRLLNQTDFKLFIGKQIADLWISSAPRYDGFAFAPDQPKIIGNKINLWEGWGTPPNTGKWPLIRQHIEEVIANGNLEHANYIMKWLAWAYQNPSIPAETAIIMQGKRGTGKSILGAKIFLQSAGQHGLHLSDPNHLFGRFNAHFRDCIFVFADESFWAGKKEAEGAVKRMITEKTLMYEAKYKDAFPILNRLHVMMASNEDWVVPAGECERRFAVFEVSDKYIRNKTYFDNLIYEIENGGVGAMMHDLMKMDLEGWHPRNDVPWTDALQVQIAHSEDPVRRHLRGCLERGVLPGTMATTNLSYNRLANEMFSVDFYTSLKNEAYGQNATSTQVGRTLGRIPGVTKGSANRFLYFNANQEPVYQNRAVTYIFPFLQDARQSFDPHHPWDDKEEWTHDISPGDILENPIPTDIPF